MPFPKVAGGDRLQNNPFSRGFQKCRVKIEDHKTLQTHQYFQRKDNFLTQTHLLTLDYLKLDHRSGEKGRVSVCTAVKQGSFTVEASLIMTFFLLSVYGILYLFLIFHIQVALQEAAEQTAQKAAQYGYIQENLGQEVPSDQEWIQAAGAVLKWGLETGFLRHNVLETVSVDMLDRSCIRGGSGGIFFGESTCLKKDGMIDVVLRYQVEIPVGFPGMTTFHFVQRSRKRAWIGAGQQEDGTSQNAKEEQVYITETGTVYHLYGDCTHIKLSVSHVTAGEIHQKRNENGRIYRACEKCCRQGSNNGVLYITRDGDHYHNTLGCSGLKRQVTAVPAENVADRPLCGRCRERREKQQ